jgi:hypothetical protein
MLVSAKNLSKLFNTDYKEIKLHCDHLLKKKLYFKYLRGFEKEKVVIDIIKRIFHDNKVVASKGRKKKWQDGWQESFAEYKKTKKELALIPKFYTARENKYFRLGGKLIQVKDRLFETKMINIHRNWYFKKYFSNVDSVYEFGAGTGFHLLEFAKIFPNKNLYGSDFVQSSVNLLKLISKRNNLNMKSFLFDMTKPNKKIKLCKNSGVYTAGSIEQLSGKVEPFIKYILSQKPKIVLHQEPVIEWCIKNQLVDYLGYLFQKKRRYTDNLLSILRDLENKGIIKIIKTMKSPFGSLMMDGNNLIVWKPIK